MASQFSDRERWEFVARSIVSLVLLIACLIVILKGQYPDAVMKWAIGIVGVIVGYWLR